MRGIGYWFPTHEVGLPRPQRLVDRDWSAAERAIVAAYLRAGTIITQYKGYSRCRFACGIADSEMGSTDLGDDEWCWPAGLAHYVEAHHVRLPDEFVSLALSRRTPPAARAATQPKLDGWLAWAAERGACVVFARGWSPMGFQDASSINKQLAAGGADRPSVLARRRDGDAILCSDFRVFSLRTVEMIASASDTDEASFERAAGIPEMSIPTEAELRAWSAAMVARPPRKLEVGTIVVWVPDGLAAVVEEALAPGRFILLGSQQGIDGQWQRFYREP